MARRIEAPIAPGKHELAVGKVENEFSQLDRKKGLFKNLSRAGLEDSLSTVAFAPDADFAADNLDDGHESSFLFFNLQAELGAADANHAGRRIEFDPRTGSRSKSLRYRGFYRAPHNVDGRPVKRFILTEHVHPSVDIFPQHEN